MDNLLLTFLSILCVVFLIEWVYKKIILPLIIYKYQKKHSAIQKQLSAILVEKDVDVKAKEVLEKLLRSHFSRIALDNIKIRWKFIRYINSNEEARSAYRKNIDENQNILENATLNEFHNIFDSSANIVHAAFIFNSLLDIIIMVFFLIFTIPILLALGLLGKVPKIFKPLFNINKPDLSTIDSKRA